MMQVPVKVSHPQAKLPFYSTSGAAGFDMIGVSQNEVLNEKFGFENFSVETQVHLAPGSSVALRTGLSMTIPEGYFLAVYPRSSKGCEGLILANTVGVIDHDYTGEISLILYNRSPDHQVIKFGERLCQGVIQPVVQAQFVLVDDLAETERGAGGFGSTGQ